MYITNFSYIDFIFIVVCDGQLMINILIQWKRKENQYPIVYKWLENLSIWLFRFKVLWGYNYLTWFENFVLRNLMNKKSCWSQAMLWTITLRFSWLYSNDILEGTVEVWLDLSYNFGIIVNLTSGWSFIWKLILTEAHNSKYILHPGSTKMYQKKVDEGCFDGLKWNKILQSLLITIANMLASDWHHMRPCMIEDVGLQWHGKKWVTKRFYLPIWSNRQQNVFG